MDAVVSALARYLATAGIAAVSLHLARDDALSLYAGRTIGALVKTDNAERGMGQVPEFIPKIRRVTTKRQ